MTQRLFCPEDDIYQIQVWGFFARFSVRSKKIRDNSKNTRNYCNKDSLNTYNNFTYAQQSKGIWCTLLQMKVYREQDSSISFTCWRRCTCTRWQLPSEAYYSMELLIALAEQGMAGRSPNQQSTYTHRNIHFCQEGIANVAYCSMSRLVAEV